MSENMHLRWCDIVHGLLLELFHCNVCYIHAKDERDMDGKRTVAANERGKQNSRFNRCGRLGRRYLSICSAISRDLQATASEHSQNWAHCYV